MALAKVLALGVLVAVWTVPSEPVAKVAWNLAKGVVGLGSDVEALAAGCGRFWNHLALAPALHHLDLPLLPPLSP